MSIINQQFLTSHFSRETKKPDPFPPSLNYNKKPTTITY